MQSPAIWKKISPKMASTPFTGLPASQVGDVVVVEGREFKVRYILIATGARPIPLDIPGQEHAVTSEEFLGLERLPTRIVLVGGGYIAAEFSHLAARAGAHVTVLQRAERMLPAFDPDLVGWLMGKFGELGIDVRTRTTVQRIGKTVDGFIVYASTNGQEQEVAADLVVHAAGREPDLAGLDLAAGGVATEDGRVKLNEFLQSVSNPKVYAAGDAARSGPPLTPVAGHDGKVVAQNLLDGNRHRPDYRGIPSVAFTIPPIAAVGLGEAEALAKGIKFRMHSEKGFRLVHSPAKEKSGIRGLNNLVVAQLKPGTGDHTRCPSRLFISLNWRGGGF